MLKGGEMISILLPTRERPQALLDMYNSAMELAENPKDVEVVVYIDEDDNSYKDINKPRLIKIGGERKTISKCWNDCWKAAKGEIYMHCGDDIRFRTQGWDNIVRREFEKYPDRIIFIYGDDGLTEQSGYEFGTHGFIHKNWADTVGYFVPPYYESDYNDTHLNDVAKELKRHVRIPIMTEHMHFSIGKSPKDQNTKDRLLRHEKQHPEEVYNSREQRIERADQIERLRQFIEDVKS